MASNPAMPTYAELIGKLRAELYHENSDWEAYALRLEQRYVDLVLAQVAGAFVQAGLLTHVIEALGADDAQLERFKKLADMIPQAVEQQHSELRKAMHDTD